MQQVTGTHLIRERITDLMRQRGLDNECYVRMLDYTIELFEGQGLGEDYYGYHNIHHELEVTLVTLLTADQGMVRLAKKDISHLYVAALLHDFDPQKNVDKPHEESVLRFISDDQRLSGMIREAGADLQVIKALILRTTYPWDGELRSCAEGQIQRCFEESEAARNDASYRQHVMDMGWLLSVVDRVSGYVLGDFARATEMAKMNAHALGWKPSRIIKGSVAYFEDLLSRDGVMVRNVLESLPKSMRENFFDTVLSFMKIRQQEISIQADHAYQNMRLVPTIESMETRGSREFIDALYEIFLELPTPLQFQREGFREDLADPKTILNTVRINGRDGKVVGFAKGGALEKYRLRDEIRDENCGAGNTVFLEPLALKMGYWGLGSGSEMRHMFIMQAHSMRYEFLTSFALRDVIRARASKERAEFVMKFDPERWDYYRIRI